LAARPLPPSIAALLCALVLVQATAWPSCQTVYCQHQRNMYHRKVEAEQREALVRDPSNFATWQALFRELSYKPARERQIARYLAHVDWELQPDLEIDLDARLRAECAAWIADWKQAFPERGEPWCAEATLEEAPQARVALLRAAADLRPDDAEVHRCLAQELRLAGAADEALALAEGFLEAHPREPGAHSSMVGLLRNRHAPPEVLRAALEESVRSLPDDRWARQELLTHYDTNGLDRERDRMLAEIEASGADLDQRAGACDALRGRSESSRQAQTGCRTRVLADFPPAEVPEEGRWQLESMREALLMTAVDARDWPEIRGQLATWPVENLGYAWMRVANHTKGEGCEPLRAAWNAGALRSALVGPEAADQAARLGWVFSGCGMKELADEVEQPFVADASDEDLSSMQSDAAVAELRRRAGAEYVDTGRWRDLDDDANRPLAERLPNLLAWHEAAPADAEPALRLSAAYAAANRGEEAVRWLVEAAGRDSRSGEDLLLKAAAMALRFRLHDAAATTARKVLAVAASPRQHAEAHYVLGRVALREGRREEAAGELLRYFPLRLRYAGACGASPDRGLLALLLGNYDLPRLRVYLDERAAAVDWYRQHLHVTLPPPGTVERAQHYEPMRCLDEPLPSPVDPPVQAACVPRGTREYLSQGGTGAAPAAERKRRLREAKAATPCPERWFSDPEPLFEDETLLSFAEPLKAVD
jgi:tetratricopeptide (TPR) repeat protein